MKKLILTLTVLMPLLLSAQSHTLTVHVKGVQSQEGKVFVSLYDSEDAFLNKALVEATATADGEHITVTFDELPAGEYALSVMHDVNGNGELDTGVFGMPLEPFGFSNDAPAKFGPAKYHVAKFSLDNSVTQTINLVTIRSSIF